MLQTEAQEPQHCHITAYAEYGTICTPQGLQLKKTCRPDHEQLHRTIPGLKGSSTQPTLSSEQSSEPDTS